MADAANTFRADSAAQGGLTIGEWASKAVAIEHKNYMLVQQNVSWIGGFCQIAEMGALLEGNSKCATAFPRCRF